MPSARPAYDSILGRLILWRGPDSYRHTDPSTPVNLNYRYSGN